MINDNFRYLRGWFAPNETWGTNVTLPQYLKDEKPTFFPIFSHSTYLNVIYFVTFYSIAIYLCKFTKPNKPKRRWLKFEKCIVTVGSQRKERYAFLCEPLCFDPTPWVFQANLGWFSTNIVRVQGNTSSCEHWARHNFHECRHTVTSPSKALWTFPRCTKRRKVKRQWGMLCFPIPVSLPEVVGSH
jgi:hypothetical protein